MHAFFTAMILTGSGGLAETQDGGKPPVPSPPPLIMFDGGMNYRPPVLIAPLGPIVAGAPAPLPRSTRPAQRAAVGCLQCYFSPDDHPARAQREHQDGIVGFRLAVNPAGDVAHCDVTSSSNSSLMDRATCRILTGRMHFRPARAADGTAVPDVFQGSVRWRLREDQGRAGVPVALVPARLLNPDATRFNDADYPPGAPRQPSRWSELRVAVGRTGRVVGCEILSGSSSILLDAAACPLYVARARYAPARNGVGVAVCDIARVPVRWESLQEEQPWRAPYPRVRTAHMPRPLRAQLNARLCLGWSPN